MSMRALTFAGASLLTSLATIPALANAGGLPGYSGKPNPAAPAGESCNQCHFGGTAPTVSLTGPATLAAGQVASYSLVVQTGQSRAAGAIASTDGVVLTPLTNVRDSFGEMVPNGGVNVAGGSATFTFKVTAPLSGTALRLWAVGLAANGSGAGGDKAAHLIKDVAVTGGTIPPDAGGGSSGGGGATDAAAPAQDPGGGTPDGDGGATTGSSGSVGTSGANANGHAGESEDPAAPGASDRGAGGASAASCAASPTSHAVGNGLLGFLLTALFVIPLVARRRRKVA